MAGLVALGEVVALEHAGHRVFRRKLDHPRRTHGVHPGRVELDSGQRRVEDLENLCLVRLRVRLDLVGRQGRSGGVAPGGVANEPREIADQEDDVVAEALKHGHPVDQHRVAKVQVRCRRVESSLYPERLAASQLSQQVGFEQHLGGAAAQFSQLLVGRQHRSVRSGRYRSARRGTVGVAACAGNATDKVRTVTVRTSFLQDSEQVEKNGCATVDSWRPRNYFTRHCSMGVTIATV